MENYYKRLNSFTLAEVLITLAVIGIVASITVPILVNKYAEQSYLEQFKKVYTELSQAYLRASQDSGGDTAANWDHPEYWIEPYLKVTEKCPQKVGCFPNVSYKGLKGGDLNSNLYNSVTSSYKYRLADGASIFIQAGGVQDVKVDINGDKGPNQYGYDAFVLNLSTKNGAPYVGSSENFYQLKDCSKTLATTNGAHARDGGACAHWIIKSWNMDYLHRDLSQTEWDN